VEDSTAPSLREALDRERAAAVARVQSLSADLEGIMADTVEANIDDEHDPEGSTIAYERARVTALLSRAQASVDELDLAMERLTGGHQAACERCGTRIPVERLAALPAARTCVDCANARS
jgi:RNA polymerase-binding transcription factor DksA